VLRTRPALTVLMAVAALAVLLVARWTGPGEQRGAGPPALRGPGATIATGPARPPAEVPAATIYLAGRDPVGIVLPGGDMRTVPVPIERSASISQLPGATIVLTAGIAWAIPAGRGPVRRLGQASAVLPAPEPGRVWLIGAGAAGPGGYELHEVSLADGRVLATKGLPSWAPPVAVTSAGVVTRNLVAGGLDLRPTPDLVARIELTREGTFADARGSLVAWAGPDGVHLRDLVSGRERVVPPPAGSPAWFVFGPPARVACCHHVGAFAPDGRTLAMFTEVTAEGDPGLAVIDVRAGTASPVPGSADAIPAGCGTCLSWHPDGGWLFYLGATPWNIGAYHLGDDTALPLALELETQGLAVPEGIACASSGEAFRVGVR
jgi:hypothetical protein